MTAPIPRDRDHDEIAWLERWQGSTGCPPPGLLLPAQDGVLPDHLAAAVRAHIASCPLCAELTVALADAETDPSAEERQRIDQRLRFQTRGGRRWRWPALAAAAVFVAVASGIYFASTIRRPATSSAQSQPSSVAPVRRGPVLALEAPAILLPAESLTLRGEARDAYAAALEDALVPFAAGNYADAAVRLEKVSRDHPRRPHAEFYTGVAKLMNGQSREAVAPLQAARGLAPTGSPLLDEVTWYLAVALERSGRGSAAAGPLSDLCGGSGPRKAQACAGLQLLTTR